MPIQNSEIEKILEPENKLQLLEPGLWYLFDEIYEFVFGEKVNVSFIDADLGKTIANGLVQAVNIAVLKVRIGIEIDRGKMKEGIKGDLNYYSRVA
jgi:hypothetical protein